LPDQGSMELYLGEGGGGYLNSRSAASVGLGVAAGLIDEVPSEDVGVLAIGHPCDGVHTPGDGLGVVLVQLDGVLVGEEVVAIEGGGREVGVVAPAGRRVGSSGIVPRRWCRTTCGERFWKFMKHVEWQDVLMAGPCGRSGAA